MLTNLKKRTEGFTIIEVMIVLAIAGLIMLIIFLAVPALQRNSRNTQRKNDVSTYAAAVNEFIQNNQGRLPTNTTIGDVNGLSNAGFLTEPTAVTALASATDAPGIDTMRIITGARCNNNTPAAGSARSFVIDYSVENSQGERTRQCQEG